MTLPLELFANSPSPGGAGPWVLTTLAEAITTLPTSGTLEDWAVSDSAPSELTTSAPQGGQFRVVIDDEIMIVVASAGGDSPWQFKRGEEGTNPALHAAGTPIYHIVTATSLTTAVQTGGLQADNNLADVPSPVDARTNLGLGSAATQPSSAFETAGTASAAVTTERTRAIAAESALAPVVSPTFTGSPTAPTRAALDSSTNIATTAYSDAAVGVEATRAQAVEATNASAIATEVARAQAAEATHATTAALATEATRAQAAEALAVQKSSNLSDLPSVSVARANLGLGSAATQSSSAFDAAGAAAAAAAASEPVGTAATAVAVEQTRAITAEAALAPLASPTFTGNPTAPTRTALDNSTKVATTAYTDAATAVEKARALGIEASLAPIANPTFTGAVGVPTRTAGDSTTNAASTAFVAAALSAISAGLITKPSVQWATAAALPANTYSAGVLTATSNGILTVDDNPPALGDRILVKNEATAANNGTYVLTQLGDSTHPYILTRGADMNTGSQVPGAYVLVQYGAGNIGSGWTVSGAGPFTIGTTAITWVQFSSAGVVNAGTGLAKSGSTISIASSASLPGSPTATTQAALDNSTKLATTAYSDAAVSVEATARANADAALAPLASPALTGNPTVPTQAALTNNTRAASTAYADAATAVEKSRAQIAEGLAAQKSNNLSDLPSPPTARTNLGLGTASLLASGAVAQVANNLSDLASAAAALANLGGAPLASPALTGTPTVPTQTALDASTKIASTAYTDSAVGVERSRALGIEAGLAPLASPALTGNPTVPTQAALNNSTRAASTAYADAAVGVEATRATTAEALKAPLASPALTGTPTAPTAAALDNTTKIATTAYADAATAVEKTRALAAEATAATPLSGNDYATRTQVLGTTSVKAPALRQFVFVDDTFGGVAGAVGDANRVFDGSMTLGSNVLTTAAPIVVGQRLEVVGASSTGSNTLLTPLVTSSPTTSLTLTGRLNVALNVGDTVVTYTTGHTQTWTLTSAAAATDTILNVASQFATFAFPATTTTVTTNAPNNLVGYARTVGGGTVTITTTATGIVVPVNCQLTAGVTGATVTYGTLDSAAWQRAHDAVEAAGGGVVACLPGRAYLLSQVIPGSNGKGKVTFSGAPGQMTTIYVDSGGSNGLPAFKYAPYQAVGTAGATNIAFERLNFVGHGNERPKQLPFQLFQIVDLRIEGCSFTNQNAGGTYIADCTRVKLIRNYLLNCASSSFTSNNPSTLNAMNFGSLGHGSASFSGTTSNNNITITNVSSFANLAVGQIITATDIPTGTTIASLNPGASSLTLSTPALGSTTVADITVVTTPLTDILIDGNTVIGCPTESIAIVTDGISQNSLTPFYARIINNFVDCSTSRGNGIWIETGGNSVPSMPTQRVIIANNEVITSYSTAIIVSNDSAPEAISPLVDSYFIIQGNNVSGPTCILTYGSHYLITGNNVNATDCGIWMGAPSGTTTVTATATTNSNTITGVTLSVTTTLSSALTAGTSYSTLPVTALPNAVPGGAAMTISGGGVTQTWQVGTSAVAGATSLTVNIQASIFAFPVGSTVTISVGNAIVRGQQISGSTLPSGTYINDNTTTLGTWVLSNPYTGSSGTVTFTVPASVVGVRCTGNQIHMEQNFTNAAIRAGSLRKSVINDNGIYCEGGSGLAVNTTLRSILSTAAPIVSMPVAALPSRIPPSGSFTLTSPTVNLSTALTNGVATTSLVLSSALGGALISGATVILTSGSNTQTWTLSSPALSTDTTLNVVSQSANFSYPSGTTTVAATQTWLPYLATPAGSTILSVFPQTPNFPYASGTTISFAIATAPGIYIQNCGWIDMSLNRIEFTPGEGIKLTKSNDVTILGNNFRNVSEAAGGGSGYSGINCVNSCTGTDNMIALNKFVDDRPSPRMLHACNWTGINMSFVENTTLGMTGQPLSTLTGVVYLKLGRDGAAPSWIGSTVALTPPVAPATWIITNPNPYTLLVTIQGGTVSTIARSGNNGVSYSLNLGSSVTAYPLPRGYQMEVVYTVAPTVAFTEPLAS